jgi:acyl-CoA synthetase (AMP-forming)/AMP-acid ligase II
VYSDYRSLAHRAARLAGALQGQLGLNAGDRVAIVAKNSPAYLELLYAVWHAGLAQRMPSYTVRNLAIFSNSQARARRLSQKDST